jgi:1-acyl-sn-glycerol-3-phosphate acyltransferase
MSEEQKEKLPEDYFSSLWVILVTITVLIIFKTLHFFRTRGGREHCPKEGPVILAPNHTSYFDPPLVTISVRRPVHYIASAYLFKNPLFSAIIRRLGAVPVDLGKSADRAAYETTLRLLLRGRVVCLFPEGTRSKDGKLAPFKAGVGRLAVAAGATIVPISIHGSHQTWPRKHKFPTPFIPIRTVVHPPLVPRPTTTAAEKREEANRLMTELERVLKSALGEIPELGSSPAIPEQKQD